MLRLGGQVLSVADARSTSSSWKGESLEDTIRTVQNYTDAIVLRHPESGAAATAAQVASVPVFNAGDGTTDHPTQGMLDALTIQRERGSIDGQTVVLCGDHLHARGSKSRAYVLSNYDARLILVSPHQLFIQREVLAGLRERGMQVEETEDLRRALQEADVVLMSRIQKERYETHEEYEQVKGSYWLNRAMLENLDRIITVMHPGPRTDELSPDVDDYPGACYFRESFNGLLVRMALLATVLGGAKL
jgi:aspartate carbamoyltransferase